MGQKKKRKAGSEKRSVEELCAGKGWQDFVTALPAEYQRLAVYAMEAWEKKAPRRMEQYTRQMTKLEGTPEQLVFELLLYLIDTPEGDQKLAAEKAEALKALSDGCPEPGEEERKALLQRLSFADGTAREFLEADRAKRSRMLSLISGSHYTNAECYEEAAKAFEGEMPFRPGEDLACFQYMRSLEKLDRSGECARLAGEFLSGREELPMTEPLNDMDLLKLRSGVLARVTARSCLILSTPKEAEKESGEALKALSEAKELAQMLTSLPKEIRYDRDLQKLLCSRIQLISSRAEEEALAEPFRILLDGAGDAKIFDGEQDPDGIYSTLLSSGYTALECYRMMKDEQIDPFLTGLITTYVNLGQYLSGKASPAEEMSPEELSDFCGFDWGLYRYQSESKENRLSMESAFERIKACYPCHYEVLCRTEAFLSKDPEEEMQRIAGMLLPYANGPDRKASVRSELEGRYQAVYEIVMEDEKKKREREG